MVGDNFVVLQEQYPARDPTYLDVLSDEAEGYTVLAAFKTRHAVIANLATHSNVERLGQRLGEPGQQETFLLPGLHDLCAGRRAAQLA